VVGSSERGNKSESEGRIAQTGKKVERNWRLSGEKLETNFKKPLEKRVKMG
jgi:hypothetical protein